MTIDNVSNFKKKYDNGRLFINKSSISNTVVIILISNRQFWKYIIHKCLCTKCINLYGRKEIEIITQLLITDDLFNYLQDK